jgi:hypothetical protein
MDKFKAATKAYQDAIAANLASRQEARATNSSRTFEEEKMHRLRIESAKNALLKIARTIEL